MILRRKKQSAPLEVLMAPDPYSITQKMKVKNEAFILSSCMKSIGENLLRKSHSLQKNHSK